LYKVEEEVLLQVLQVPRFEERDDDVAGTRDLDSSPYDHEPLISFAWRIDL
jgi:hypothetical protein